MAATPEGNRKIAAGLKEKFGVDKRGKSKFHKRIGTKGAESKESYFATLKRTDPEKLRQIATKGAKASHVETQPDQT